MNPPTTPGSLIKIGRNYYFKLKGELWMGVNTDTYSNETIAGWNVEVIHDATPPVIEPTKLGAVVVNNNNEAFVRISTSDMPWWDCRAGCDERWSRIVEPKVLFEGVV